MKPSGLVFAALIAAFGACSCAAAADDAGTTKDALFGDDATAALVPARGWTGYVQGELARTYADPGHWSRTDMLVDLSREGRFSGQVKWKIGARLSYDGVYDRSGFYPQPVRQDQRSEFMLRENYLDVSAGDWDWRLGRQQVVWGEMVGMFIADVVSAKDMREFVLPEFDQMRIPQWAARAEYFKGDSHAEFLWIPIPSYDDIGKPGADFYPYPLPGPGGTAIQDEQRPRRTLANSNYGLRLSTLKNGWDVSGFYYHSLDAAATFYRNIVPGPAPLYVYQPRHDPIDQAGATLAKDLGSAVLKAEAVYTNGRKFSVTRMTQADGLVPQNTFDYALGLDFSLPADTRLNLQFFQRIYTNHDPDIIQDRIESGASILLNRKLTSTLEAQALLIHSLNRSDWLFRPSLTWTLEQNWRLRFGADVFGGPPTGIFGQYDKQDRVYTEARYSF